MESMNVDLLEAAKSGNVDLLRQLHASHLLGTTPQQNTALHIAVRFGHEEFVKEICCRDVSMLLKANSRGETPLHLAATLGYASIVTFFIHMTRAPTASQQCPDIEQPGDNEPLRQLLRATNKKGDTALHEAVRNGHNDVALNLLNVLPELSNVLNGDGESVLYIAVTRPSHRVFSALVGGSFLDRHGYKGPHRRTALHAAVLARHIGIVQKLLQATAELTKEEDDTGSFPLHYAAESIDSHMMRMILQVDFSAVYSVNKDGNSPLHLCARQGNVITFHDIVTCCPDSVDLADTKGKNVLHIAIENGKIELVRHILGDKSLTGLINHRDNDGNTPLHTAAAKQDDRCIFELLKKETLNRKVMNNEGKTPFDVLFTDAISRFSVTWYMAAYVLNFAFWGGDSIASFHHRKKMLNLVSESAMSRRKENVEKLLVIATLVATVTFAAAFALPGGYSNDGPRAGGAVLVTKTAFKAFLLSDTLAMLFSVLAVLMADMAAEQWHPSAKWLELADVLLGFSFGAMAVAFGTGVYVVVAPDCLWLAILVCLISCCIPLFIFFPTYWWTCKLIYRQINDMPYVTEYIPDEAPCRMVTPTFRGESEQHF